MFLYFKLEILYYSDFIYYLLDNTFTVHHPCYYGYIGNNNQL